MARRARAPRRTVLVAAALSLGATGLVVLSSSSSLAADSCLTETDSPVAGPLSIFTQACNDATPPVTDLPTASPSPTSSGYTKSTTLAFTLHGHYTDADADPMSFECQFWNGDETTTPPDPATGTWSACGDRPSGSTPTTAGSLWTATMTKTGLADSVGADYHLRVRAVDGTRGLTGTGDSSTTRYPHDALQNPITDTPDLDDSFDATTQEITFRIDTAAPNTFLTDEPVDDETPDRPVVTSQTVPLSLDSFDSSGAIAGFACALNGRLVACAQGAVRLTDLSPGKKTFLAVAVDRAGNIDPVPAKTVFWVPRNLTLAMAGVGGSRARSCAQVSKATFFGGDVIRCTRAGDELHFAAPSEATREIRLIAPAGPRMGVVEINVGEGRWIPVDLYAETPQTRHVYLVRDQYEPPKGGQVRVRVKSVTPARPYVKIDAVLAR